MGFPHSEKVTNRELIDECILPVLGEFYDRYKDVLPEKPEVSMFRMDRLGRGFLIRMFFPEGKINTFYNIQPELMQNIVRSLFFPFNLFISVIPRSRFSSLPR